MCARYQMTKLDPSGLRQLMLRFDVAEFPEVLQPRYNARPTQELPAIVHGQPEAVRLLRWGLIPGWAPDTKMRYATFNARVEDANKKPAFRNAWRKGQRCLVLSDGFYEWVVAGDGTKTPLRIVIDGGEPFAMAGLWETWAREGQEPVHSFTILTREPNEFMKPIHNRMPVVLRQEDEQVWLNPRASAEDIFATVAPFPPERMSAYEVSRAINSPKSGDEPFMIRPTDPGQATTGWARR